VFFDEISRCRPDMQNKLFPIIHERRVQGVALEGLLHRWSAMNPPARDGEETEYAGSEPLDTALADRFAFIVEVPDWQGFTPELQEAVILNADRPLPGGAGTALKSLIASARGYATVIRESFGPQLAAYTRLACAVLRQAGIALSARRAGMLLRNIVGVHATREAASPGAALSDSALLALTHSLPQRAMGQPCDRLKLLAAHKEAWKAAAVEDDGPMRLLICEADPLRRALLGVRASKLKEADFSTVISDALASLPPGANHALALELFETDACGRLVAAVAEQCAELYAVVATPQDVHESIASGSVRHRTWQRVVARLAKLDASDPETPLVANLLPGLFAAGGLSSEAEVDRVLESWLHARAEIRGGAQ
jgi:MoxR-like ATPase